MGIEELIGGPYIEFNFEVLEVNGDEIVTDFHPRKFNRQFVPFDYKVGEVYNVKRGENGWFVTAPNGEAYFKPLEGTPIKVQGDLNEFINKYKGEGRDRFKRLLTSNAIIAYIRVNRYDKQHEFVTLDVILTQDIGILSENGPFYFEEAYYILIDLKHKSGKIVKAAYRPEHGLFYPKISPQIASQSKLPENILTIAQSEELIKTKRFVQVDQESMRYIIANCFR